MTKGVRVGLVLSSLLAGASVYGQANPAWEKSYALSGQPVLELAASDSGLSVHSCGACRSVHIEIVMENAKLSDYRLEESQSGDTVRFSLKERPGVHLGWHSGSVKVLVEAPEKLTLNARTSDGGLKVSGLHGELNLESSDGGQDLENLSGNLKVRTSDGGVRLRGGSGTLEAHSADGSLEIAGAFDSLQVASNDGSVRVELQPGTKLRAASHIESHDGSVTVRVPQELAAEFDLHTQDGGLSSDLPLMTNGYNSAGAEAHAIHGTLNGGGPLLSIRSTDGSVRVSRD